MEVGASFCAGHSTDISPIPERLMPISQDKKEHPISAENGIETAIAEEPGKEDSDLALRKNAWSEFQALEQHYRNIRLLVISQKEHELSVLERSIENGTHPDLGSTLARLEKERDRAIQVARHRRDLNRDMIMAQYEAELYRCHRDCLIQRANIRSRLQKQLYSDLIRSKLESVSVSETDYEVVAGNPKPWSPSRSQPAYTIHNTPEKIAFQLPVSEVQAATPNQADDDLKELRRALDIAQGKYVESEVSRESSVEPPTTVPIAPSVESAVPIPSVRAIAQPPIQPSIPAMLQPQIAMPLPFHYNQENAIQNHATLPQYYHQPQQSFHRSLMPSLGSILSSDPAPSVFAVTPSIPTTQVKFIPTGTHFSIFSPNGAAEFALLNRVMVEDSALSFMFTATITQILPDSETVVVVRPDGARKKIQAMDIVSSRIRLWKP